MILMLLVVLCYTITSLNDKYAVSRAGMNGSQMTFIMAAATSFFMVFTLPFSDRTFTFSPLSVIFILLIVVSKMLEFQMSARVLTELSAFELKAWLGICLFMSYFTDIFMGTTGFSVLKIVCIAVTAAGLFMIAASGKKNINYKKIILPLILYLLAKFGYGLIVTGINSTACMSSNIALFIALIILAVILFPRSGISSLIKEKPKETAIVALAKIPNAAGLMLENAVIAVSMANYSFIQPMILVVLFVLSIFGKEKYSPLNLAGGIVCIVGIAAFQAVSLI